MEIWCISGCKMQKKQLKMYSNGGNTRHIGNWGCCIQQHCQNCSHKLRNGHICTCTATIWPNMANNQNVKFPKFRCIYRRKSILLRTTMTIHFRTEVEIMVQHFSASDLLATLALYKFTYLLTYLLITAFLHMCKEKWI